MAHQTQNIRLVSKLNYKMLLCTMLNPVTNFFFFFFKLSAIVAIVVMNCFTKSKKHREMFTNLEGRYTQTRPFSRFDGDMRGFKNSNTSCNRKTG